MKKFVFIWIFVYLKLLNSNMVIWIDIGGIGSQHLNKLTMPFLFSLTEIGTVSYSLNSGFIAHSLPTSYSMSTGLYPAHHGILGPAMISDKQNIQFRKEKFDLYWWDKRNKTKPIWFMEVGTKKREATLCIAWPGCHAIHGNIYPYVIPGDGYLDSDRRLNLASQLMIKNSLSHFGMIHLGDIEDSGSKNGIDDEKAFNNVLKNHDALLEKFYNDILESKQKDSVNLIITSSFSMDLVKKENVIDLYKITNQRDYIVAYDGPTTAVYTKNENVTLKIQADLQKLIGVSIKKLFTKSQLPKSFRFEDDDRTPDLIIFSETSYCIKGIKSSSNCKGYQSGYQKEKDEHNKNPSMGFMIAVGPDINNVELGSLELVDIYPLLCALLLIKDCPNGNGTLAKTVTALSINHPVLVGMPTAKITLVVVLLIALVFTIVAFLYTHCSNFFSRIVVTRLKKNMSTLSAYNRLNSVDEYRV